MSRSSPNISGSSRLGGDPEVVGRSITLDGMAHTIVGVLPNMPVAVGRAKWQ